MFDPYEVMGLDKTYALDMRELEQNYFEKQREYHPDQFMNASPGQKARALKISTELNQAYALLKDPIQRALFLLKAKNVEPLSHDSETLALVMDWNEKLDSGEDLSATLNQMQNELVVDIKKGFAEEDFEKVRKALYRQSYVSKILKDRKQK